jgi:cyclase
MEKVKDNIYVETEYLGCNASFVITSEGIVMVDTPLKPEDAFQWRREIYKNGNIKYIINTDHHKDHAIGNYYFGADTIMHEGTMRKLIAADYVENCRDWIKSLDPQSGSLMNNYFVRKPKFTFTDKMTIYVGDDIFELSHIKSHTEDETLVYMPNKKVLFTGDTVCTNGIPNLYQSYPLEWLKSLEMIGTLDFEVLVPGHGEIGNKNSAKQFHNELSMLINRAQETIDQGLSREAFISEFQYKDCVHSEYPSKVSEHFEQNRIKNIARLYDSLIK